jgi:cellulose biosynthesis protein BcsQ
MRSGSDLLEMSERSLQQQEAVRKKTFAPDDRKTLRRFSIWEMSEFMFGVPADTLRKKLMENLALPQGTVEEDGRQRWFSLEDINTLRKKLTFREKSLLPERPNGRSIRIAIANFKGGVGKSVVAQHMANAAALDGYRVLVVDFDPQATLTHSVGLVEVREESTVWGIMCRDLCREADRIASEYDDIDECPYPTSYELPEDVQGLGECEVDDFIFKTCWPTIDIVPSCANAAFVEFASAKYRSIHSAWTFFGCVERFLSELPDERYDFVIFDCPPAIGYQSMNAVFAADILYVPSGPGYWEYDSTTSFLGQLGEALEEISTSFASTAEEAGISLPKEFFDVRILMTRYEKSNPLHNAMLRAYQNVFGEDLCISQIELTRAVEQSGRFQNSVYEQDYRGMTRDTWRRARDSFDRVWGEMKETALVAWRNGYGARETYRGKQQSV